MVLGREVEIFLHAMNGWGIVAYLRGVDDFTDCLGSAEFYDTTDTLAWYLVEYFLQV
jgi:hypothetical protein